VLVLVLEAPSQTVTTITEGSQASGGLALGPDGLLYAGDWTNVQDDKHGYGAAILGTQMYRISMEGEVSLFADFGDFRSGLTCSAFGPDGLLYQSCAGADIVARVNADGEVATHAEVDEPYGLVAADNGDLYVLSRASLTMSKIVRIRPGGEVEDVIELPSKIGFAQRPRT
jgi:sugar lactone lactonase YvrE